MTVAAGATHYPKHKLDLLQELCNKCDKVTREAKTDTYMNKVLRGKGSGTTEECFRYLREMKKQEVAALKILENYLKTDTAQHSDHHHHKDLAKVSVLLKTYA